MPSRSASCACVRFSPLRFRVMNVPVASCDGVIVVCWGWGRVHRPEGEYGCNGSGWVEIIGEDFFIENSFNVLVSEIDAYVNWV